MYTITFQGAARTTTGSMHIVDVNGLRILLDCGLYQGHRKEAFERNRRLMVDPKTVDCVLLSHAHIDHSGNLPSLIRAGWRGPIYTTEATRDLCDPMLRDCAYITQHDVEIVNRRRIAEGRKPFEPLYDERDVEGTLALMQGVPYKRAIDLGNGVGAVFHNAGHILGSALVDLVARQPNGVYRRLLFSGDVLFQGSIGRADLQGGNFEELKENICNRLFTLPDDVVVYPGHGSSTTIGYEKRNNPFFI